jgi:hypothetical protein
MTTTRTTHLKPRGPSEPSWVGLPTGAVMNVRTPSLAEWLPFLTLEQLADAQGQRVSRSTRLPAPGGMLCDLVGESLSGLSLDPPVNLVTAAGRNTRIPF